MMSTDWEVVLMEPVVVHSRNSSTTVHFISGKYLSLFVMGLWCFAYFFVLKYSSRTTHVKILKSFDTNFFHFFASDANLIDFKDKCSNGQGNWYGNNLFYRKDLLISGLSG